MESAEIEAEPALPAALLRAEAYPHAVSGLRLIETHISWVFLTGEFAYKVKKPVNFGFLDFSTRAGRAHFCREELRINRGFAPGLYLDVVTLTESEDGLRIGGEGEVVEHAVRMRQFDPAALLAERAGHGGIAPATWRELGTAIARVHATLPRAPADDRARAGSPGALRDALVQNFRQARRYLRLPADIDALNRIEDWTWSAFARLETQLWRRYEQGFVRECHGDLHLGNVALIDGHPVPFDALEFNPALRWIDIQNEIAFLLMDAESHGERAGGYRALDAWLERGGDYAGLGLLRFFLVYRAMVRAKVSLLVEAPPVDAGGEAHGECLHYLALAESAGTPPPACLLLMCGVSGSGKSTVAEALAASLGAIRVRSDVERKRLFGLAPEESSRAVADIYTAEAGRRTFARLAECARSALAAGFPAILDATFIRRGQRAEFRALAAAAGVPCLIIVCRADPEELRRRVQARALAGGDASEAGVAVLEAQLAVAELPVAGEEAGVLEAQGADAASIEALCAAIRRRMAEPARAEDAVPE